MSPDLRRGGPADSVPDVKIIPVLKPVLFTALLAIASGAGCVAVVVGAGAGAAVAAVAYVRGDLDATLNASFDKSIAAANKAVEQLQFVKVSQNRDALQAIIVARNAADKKIEFRIEKVGDGVTTLKIRVGVFGDEALSLAILDKVKANL